MISHPSTSLFLGTGLGLCLVSLHMLSITYFSRWQHERMHTSKKFFSPQHTHAVRSSKCLPLLSYNHCPRLNRRCGKTLNLKYYDAQGGMPSPENVNILIFLIRRTYSFEFSYMWTALASLCQVDIFLIF